MSSARVVDFTPKQAGRWLDKEAAAKSAAVLDDVADGILALDFALTFAGFSYKARQLTLSIVGLLGGGGGRLEIFDKILAQHARCSDRTVRRWRAAHIEESRAKKFSLLYIEEGDYNGRKRYEKTAYSLNPAVASYLNAVVSQARASDLYWSDRVGSVERAAEEHYHEIPDAPPRTRRRKPRPAPTVRVERAFDNAARNVEKGKLALWELDDESLMALRESKQGEELRLTLLKLQADIAEALKAFPQVAESEQVEEGLGQDVLTPAVSGQDEPRGEDVALWEGVERRAAGAPHVTSCEVPLRLPSPDESPPPAAQSVEDAEAEAIRLEGCGEGT